MTEEQRGWLVTLKQAKRGLIRQREAAVELKVTERHVRRLIAGLREIGDRVVIHGLRGQPSNRRIDEAQRQKAMEVLSADVYAGFGPTLALEHLREQHPIAVSKETLRQWMMEAKLWRGKKAKASKPHLWRPRRSRFGELVQWDTSEHDWLEGRGEKLYLIAMIDDATSRLLARFVRHDSTVENMRLLWSYLEKHGRPAAFYTDKASLFRTAERRRRDEPGVDQDVGGMPATQIARALRELGIVWIAAHSPQAKGRVERNFGTAQDRLVKGMRVAGVTTLEQANAYLEKKYLPWWNRTLTVAPARAEDAHRPLEESVDLAGVLSHVEARQVDNGYTLRLNGQRYRITGPSMPTGLRQAAVRVEWRLDGSIAVRYQERYLTIEPCAEAPLPARAETPPKLPRPASQRGRDWNRDFDLKKAPPVWIAARSSGHRRSEVG